MVWVPHCSPSHPVHLAAFFFEAIGQRKKLQKRKAVSVRLCLTLRPLFEKSGAKTLIHGKIGTFSITRTIKCT
jgi:hypothetical protein